MLLKADFFTRLERHNSHLETAPSPLRRALRTVLQRQSVKIDDPGLLALIATGRNIGQ